MRLPPGRGTSAAQSQRPGTAQSRRPSAAQSQGLQCSTDSGAPVQHRLRGAGAALREGWSEAEVCAEKLPFRGGLCTERPGGSHCGSIGKKSTIRKKITIGKKRAKMGNLH